ncbi:CopD family protein [bacterium SCSIO 12741]|nr:CopD family protein [bacterium SCSIO 12741]
MSYLYFKALHIIFVVTWFAGLFYIVRLFIYQTEASEKEEPERSILIRQFRLMQKRLWYGITWPSAILTGVFAGGMLYLNPSLLTAPFMHLKLSFVFGLYLYHIACHSIFRNLAQDRYKHSSFKLRIWNEVATVFLVSIVFIISLRDLINWVWGLIGLLVFSGLLMIAIRTYKRIRKQNN